MIKKTTLLILTIGTIAAQFLTEAAYAQVSFNTTLLGQLAPVGIKPSGGHGYRDIWGYYDPVTDKEFAILCYTEKTFIIDVSDPENPTVATTLEESSVDVKTFSNFLVNSKGTVWDISDIYNPVVVNINVITGHNIYIDYPYGYSTKQKIIDMSNPKIPTVVGMFAGTSHDIIGLSDTVYYAGSTMQIYDVSAPSSPKLLMEFGFTDDNSSAHNAFPTVDRNHLLITDEFGPLGLSIWDISDPDAPTQVAQYGPLHDIPTVHNVYVKENYAYISHYVDGLRILDISDPTNPIEAGYYDTYPDDVVYFEGAWGVYPFAPSGNIYVSDIKYGLFIIKFDGSDSLIKISGTVKDKISGQPIKGAWSFVRGVYKGVSDSQGNYVFHAPKGTHNVITRMFNYLPDTSEVVLSIGSPVILNIEIEQFPTSVSETVITNPQDYNLRQNHPNPFNPTTTIAYDLPVASDVTLTIYNMRGQEVARLVDAEQSAGEYQTEWNASNVSSGIYFYRLQAGDFVQTRKMVLLR